MRSILASLRNNPKYGWYVVGALVALLVIFNIPVNQHNTLTRGIDRFESHRPLFSERTQAQDVLVSRGLEGVGAILVNLRHSKNPADVLISVTDPDTGKVWREARIPGNSLTDDEFTTVTFSEPLDLTNQHVRITLSAPTATKETAMGVRFHPEDVYPGSTRLENNEPKPGDLSLTLVEKVPMWQYLVTSSRQNPDRTMTVATAITIGLALAIASLLFLTRATAPTLTWWPAVIFLLIALASFSWRLQLVPQFKGVSGGDAYNYLFITQKIVQGLNPMEDTKRLPGFPLLLLPAYLTSIDDQMWMRGLSVLSGALILLVLPRLARTLGLPWNIQLLSVVMLAVTRDFWRTSLRPEPYTFYSLLLILAVWLLYNLKRWPQQLALGFLLGYAAMTRQEGFVLAVVIALCTLIQWRQLWWRGYARIFIPAFILVLPFFISNQINFGNPFFTPYFDGDRLQIVDSWPAFVDNIGAAWGTVGTWWWPRWEQDFRVNFANPFFLVALFGTIIWNLLKQWPRLFHSRTVYTIAAILGFVLLSSTIWFSVTQKAAFLSWLLMTTAGLLLGSVISFCFTTRWRGVPILLITLSQGLIAVWFHPFAKHFQQIWPFLVLMVSTTLAWPFSGQTLRSIRWPERVVSVMWCLGLIPPLVVGNIWLWQMWPVELDRVNESNALDSVVYCAVRDAKLRPGPYGVDQAYLPARLYFAEEGEYFVGDEPHSQAEEVEWLQKFNIQTLVLTNNNSAFKPLPAGWYPVAHHKSAGKNDVIYESWVYIRR